MPMPDPVLQGPTEGLGLASNSELERLFKSGVLSRDALAAELKRRSTSFVPRHADATPKELEMAYKTGGIGPEALREGLAAMQRQGPAPGPQTVDLGTIGLESQGLNSLEATTPSLPPSGPTAPRTTVAIPEFFKNPERLQRTLFTATGKIQPEKGEGKGSWVPFNAMPTAFKEKLYAEVGEDSRGMFEQGGWWTGDLNGEEKTLVTRLSQEGMVEKQKLAMK